MNAGNRGNSRLNADSPVPTVQRLPLSAQFRGKPLGIGGLALRFLGWPVMVDCPFPFPASLDTRPPVECPPVPSRDRGFPFSLSLEGPGGGFEERATAPGGRMRSSPVHHEEVRQKDEDGESRGNGEEIMGKSENVLGWRSIVYRPLSLSRPLFPSPRYHGPETVWAGCGPTAAGRGGRDAILPVFLPGQTKGRGRKTVKVVNG
ncbi:hypothetical protein AKJ66_00135 [candidate division MSBL1 archaeon SCGC-AAA259E22]|uniref:Uncharacterized protein n=1 Tax=candidate division MSBL1 archaeon SCGC-AAA259E22 TaxID=1698265 RepID=A0A133UIL2_9EURY|nr:hypothetical protein AKJ66_00135 [candidate division MSBL1 archaeon SCGC-AAA259E22]